MPFGFRRPSLRKSFSARLSPRRLVSNRLGLRMPRGTGWIRNPKTFAYNQVYSRTTVGFPVRAAGTRRRRPRQHSQGATLAPTTPGSTRRGFGVLMVFVGLLLLAFAWPIALAVLPAGVLLIWWGASAGTGHVRTLRATSIEDIDSMDTQRFEQCLHVLFRGLGYSGVTTKAKRDRSLDLLLQRRGETTFVQAKRYSRRIGVSEVRAAETAMRKYGARRAIVLTNGDFTEPARKLATTTAVELMDRNRLTSALQGLADADRAQPQGQGPSQPEPPQH